MRMETKLTFHLFLHGFLCRNSRALVSSLHYFSAVQFNVFLFSLGCVSCCRRPKFNACRGTNKNPSFLCRSCKRILFHFCFVLWMHLLTLTFTANGIRQTVVFQTIDLQLVSLFWEVTWYVKLTDSKGAYKDWIKFLRVLPKIKFILPFTVCRKRHA